MVISEAELKRKEARLALEDPYYFETEVLRVGKDEKKPRLREEMGPFFDWLCEPRDKNGFSEDDQWLRYWSSPRFTAKSVGLASWCCEEIVKDPNIAIMVQSEEKRQAVKIVDMVRHWLELPKVEKLFGNFESPRKWKEDEFTVAQRTVTGKKDPTMQASGMDVPMTGWHPDIIIWDDLLGETNNTRDGVAKVKARLSASLPVLRDDGIGIWVCTRWGPEDPASEILSGARGKWDLPGHRGFFGAYAVPGDEKFYPHAVAGEPLYPTVWPRHRIENARKTWPFELFASQVLNDPVPAEGAYFRSSDFQYFPLYTKSADGLSIMNPVLDDALCFMAIDPASGQDQSEKGDEHAIVVGYIKWLKNICRMYLVEEAGGRWKTDKLVDAIATLIDKWRPRKIFIETHTYQDWMMSPLKRREQEFGVHYPIEEVKRGGKGSQGKSDRVMSLQTPYTYHQVWHAEELKNGRVEEQLLRFRPNPKDHDDFRDAEAMLWQEATKRRYGRSRKEGGGGWKVGRVGGPVTYPRTGV
jgi:hypothetical protein